MTDFDAVRKINLLNSQLYFRAFHSGKNFFELSSDDLIRLNLAETEERMRNHPGYYTFLPKLIQQPQNSSIGRYEWDLKKNDTIIESLVRLTLLSYPHKQEIKTRDSEHRQLHEESISLAVNEEEVRLQEELLKNVNKFLCGFRYLYTFDWSIFGKNKSGGSLVLTDGYGIFAVVEIKTVSTPRGRNQGSKKKIEEDHGKTFKEIFFEKNRDNPEIITIIGVNVTDGNGIKVEFSNEKDKLIAEMVSRFRDPIDQDEDPRTVNEELISDQREEWPEEQRKRRRRRVDRNIRQNSVEEIDNPSRLYDLFMFLMLICFFYTLPGSTFILVLVIGYLLDF